MKILKFAMLILFLGIGLALQSSADRVQLNTSAAVVNDNLGTSVGISGDYAMVGVPNDDTDNGGNAGSIQVFFRSETGWVQHQKLNLSDAAADDEFGTTLAMSGDYAIVGVPRKDDIGKNSGAAYIFARQGTQWVEQMKLVPLDGKKGDYFGISVAIAGDMALVGAHRANHPVADAGAAYIFERRGNIWIQTTMLTAPDATRFANFGFSVGTDGRTAIIGAIRDDEAGENAGAAYIFIRDPSGWIFQKKLIGNNTEANDNFGYAVDVDGDFAIVASPSNEGT
ncbi:MAG: FG-GAP repeat protein, partial [Proteobacteria bacterium]|nr:FG-GAP repeat protein [Pseudomonadota bacterium]